ncbi:FYVE and coiled-coil domain-containing protein 1-like 1, partial [Homarus americanus]
MHDDNMASNRRPVGINFEKILQSVQNDVREMKIEFEESGLPITDDNKQLHQFCERLEFILKFGLRERNSLKTGVGRGRCFLRYCLVHQCMGDVLQQCVDNQSVSRHFYQDGALLTDAKLSPTLLNCLYQLCDVPFDLPPTGHDLDVSWPTFSRHGSAGGGWLPPSRAVSLSSLSSYSSQ